MTTEPDRLELAERCEKATGLDRPSVTFKERLLRKWIRKYLSTFKLEKLLSIIWDEHRYVFYEDNIPTRYHHFELCLGSIQRGDLQRQRDKCHQSMLENT